MIFEDFENSKKEYYKKMLRNLCSLSRLFSESNNPYLDYRMAENIFCRAFNAINVSREDSSIDAVYQTTGIGIKTFQGNSAQKIAEFNKKHSEYAGLNDEEKIIKISGLRNKRIESAYSTYGLDDAIYHCIKRKREEILIYEEPIKTIRIDSIGKIKKKKSSIYFSDGIEDYIFNLSKSVLMKKFSDENPIASIGAKIIENPYRLIEGLDIESLIAETLSKEYIFLPLYSEEKGVFIVPPKSGLNHWNASEEYRRRDRDEAYIRIPAWIKNKYPDFFPSRNESFNLILPNGTTLSAKVCQAGDKALMSNPNILLGRWILRDVLRIEVGKLVTYSDLEDLGIDSVIVKKIDDSEYQIDFKELGAYERFKEASKD